MAVYIVYRSENALQFSVYLISLYLFFWSPRAGLRLSRSTKSIRDRKPPKFIDFGSG